MKRKSAKFSKDFLPLRTPQDASPFTTKPRLTKMSKGRKRNPSLSMLDSVKRIEKLMDQEDKEED
jgi:hypothetical protein